MGCGSSSAKEHTALNPKRIAVESSIAFPSYWAIGESLTRKCTKCEVSEPNEMAALQELMDKTLLADSGKRLVVEFAMRIEDSHMWDDYRRAITYISDVRGKEVAETAGTLTTTKSGHLEEMPLTTRNLPQAYKGRLVADANETYLWHATPRAAAEKIVKEDFQTHMAGSANGQVLGRGIYLAESCSLADEYACKGPQGRYCMLLCRSVLGKVHATRRFSRWRGKKLVMTTFTTKLVKAGECDSVLGDRGLANRKGVREYCVANNTQLYPEYLILYNRVETKGKVVPQ